MAAGLDFSATGEKNAELQSVFIFNLSKINRLVLKLISD